MQKSWATPLLAVGGMIFACCALGQEIHLKTRTIATVSPGVVEAGSAVAGTAELRPITPVRGSPRSIHEIVQFDHPPGVEDLNALLLEGAQVTGALPDNAVVVTVPGGLSRRPPSAVWVGLLEPADKLSPELASPGANSDALLLSLVEFHSDIPLAQQDAVETALGLAFLHPPGLLPQHAMLQASVPVLRKLAARDEVAYIFPADPALLTDPVLNSCAGMLTTAGMIAQYANVTHGWDLDADHLAHLSYFFGGVTTKVPSLTAQAEVVRALNAWATHANVAFQPGTAATLARSVYIKFVSGAHGDPYPFDGPGGALAHTFYPVPVNAESLAGDMHFDADENWHAGGDIDIYSVALHEAGHAIGLSHSDKPGDVMYPYYRRGMSLSAGDIGAAQQLYGMPGGVSPVTSTTTTSTPVPVPLPLPGQPSIPALSLTVDSLPATTPAAQVNVTGTATGGTAPDAVQWQTDHGYAGNASITSSGAWFAAGIPLITGPNTITLTAFDAAAQVSTHVATITRQQPAVTTNAPVAISIASPASSVVSISTATLSVSGTASGGAGISLVIWQTSNGASGSATGAEHWLAAGIPLPQGNTTIVIRAFDAKGASAWVALVAVRR